MDHSRHQKRHRSSSKSKKSSKKKRSRDENGSSSDSKIVSVSSSVIKPLVEYSDVSSEDLSEPEAGEIQSEESPPIDGLHHDERDPYRRLSRKSLSVSHRLVDSSIISHSPSPRNERKHSVSSDVSRSSSMRRKRHDSSPHAYMRQQVNSPTLEPEDYEYRKHRKKKEKKHKKEKKSSKKKKKKSKRSRSSSIENVSDSPKRNIEQLSDWEPTYAAVTIDQVTCSPISPASNHSSGHDRIDHFSPRSGTPTQPPPKKFLPVESPHTPQLPPKAYEATKIDNEDQCSNYSGRKQLSGSPVISDPQSISPVRVEEYRQSWGRHSLSPVKSSPFRNPSPEVQIIG